MDGCNGAGPIPDPEEAETVSSVADVAENAANGESAGEAEVSRSLVKVPVERAVTTKPKAKDRRQTALAMANIDMGRELNILKKRNNGSSIPNGNTELQKHLRQFKQEKKLVRLQLDDVSVGRNYCITTLPSINLVCLRILKICRYILPTRGHLQHSP